MSFVTKLSIDGHRSTDPTWDDVARAIESLDGSARTPVTLGPSSREGDERHMGIGGGMGGRCVVYVTDDNLTFWNLEDRSSPGTRAVLIVAGGQEGDFREEQCVVPKSWALKAARRHFDDGSRAPDLPWCQG